MKHILSLTISLLMLCLGTVQGQTIKTIGGLSADYATMQSAFAAINIGTLKGQIILQVTGSTTETVLPVLYQSGYNGVSNYSSVIIYPTVESVAISTSSNFALIDLNGADNVTIDGRINQTGTSNSLTISGTSTGNGAAAIRLLNSAENNIIKYCNISGSSSSSAMGIVSFAGSSAGNGNDNNILELCNLTCSGVNRPYNAILSSGTSGRDNSGVIIRNNNIYNTFQAAVSSNSININSASIGFTISGNSIYETSAFVATASGLLYNAIRISTTTEHIISGNYIGGNSPQCGGTAWSFTAPYAVYFCGIYAYAGPGIATTISNNIIANINFSSKEDNPWDGIFLYSGNFDVTGNTIGSPSGTGSIRLTTTVPVATTTLTGGVVTAIELKNGGSGYAATPPIITFSVSGSTTPATATAIVSGGVVTGITLLTGGTGYTSIPSVIFDGQSNNYSTSHGMIQNSTGTVNITGNNIGSITTVGSDFYSHGFESVYVRGVQATTTLSNNLIGSLTTPFSIYTSSAAASSLNKQDVYGLYSSSTLTTIISGNTIANLVNGYTGIKSDSRTRGIQTIAGTNTIQNNTVRDISTTSKQSSGALTASVIGISQTSAVAGTTQTVSGNTVYNLSNSNPSAKVFVTGIYYTGPATGTNTISGNFIHRLSIISSDYLSDIEGIELVGGTYTCANNIISLGNDTIGNSIPGGYVINGIWDELNTDLVLVRNIYFNSVYICGTATVGTSITTAFKNETRYGTRNYKNNILFNARSGTGKHYAIYIKSNDVTTLSNNYNDYWVSGSNSILGYVGADKATFIALQQATGQDVNSLNINPSFTVPGGSSAINYYPSAVLPGVAGTGVATDYFDITRGLTPKMGAIEANANVWQGATSSNFGTATNWTTGLVPASGADIIFATSPANDCVLDMDRTLGNISNGSSKNLLVNGKTLTVTKSLDFTSSGKINTSTASSIVKFAGSEAQIIPSAAFVSNSVAGLTISNSNGVALNGDLTVSAVLTLTSGILAIGANTFTISGSSPTSAGGTVDASNALVELVFANTAGITLPATFFSGAVNNLTLSGVGGVTAGSDITVNGILNLAAANPSATRGLLEMVISYTNYPGTTISQYLNSHLLNMGDNATTVGIGDVTGTVKRTSIVANTPYTFGHQYTTISLTAGEMPSAIAVSITIGTSPMNTKVSDDIIDDAIRRTYEIVPTNDGSGSTVTANFHYLTSELRSSNSPNYLNTEQKLTTMDYDIQGGFERSDEHGRANYDYTNKYIGLSSVPISYFIQIPSTHEWRTIFALRDYGVGYFTWDGSENTTNWNTPANWTVGVGGSGVPTPTGHVIIPDAGTTPVDPELPSGTTIINTISIENGGVLNMGSNTLKIQTVFSGGWEDQNPIGNDPGTSTVIFNRPNTTISGNARFYNVQIAAIDATIDTIADITNQAGSTMKIGGAITRTGLATGKWYADVFGATVEYNGGSQTVLLPDGSPNYHNLILSGSGTKTLPSGLSMHGDFIITGTALGVAGGPVTTNGNMSIGPNASYTAGSYAHTNGGFIIYSDASGTGSLIASSSFSGTVERYIAKDIKWHFLASPIAAQPIWPEFAPAPFDDPLTFGASPWGWDFYYWNPKALTASELYWVNLRQDNSGTYNARSIDATGSLAGFGTATPEFAIGRGYLAAYNANWSPSTGSPEIHRFTGSLNSGAIARAILNDANPYNLVGNPFPSSIDWQSTGWAGQRDALANNGGGYDYWIYNDSDANYGVFNSATGEGTHSTSRYIAPMQGFFVQANTSGTLNMSNVQVHSSQTWLKDGVDTDNMLRLKLTTSANTFNDEMLVAVNAAYENGGSPKFWSMENDSPELYSIRGSSSYSIDRLSAVDENSVVVLGVSAKLTGSYTIKATGVSSFSAASSLILEDLKTGNTQELKSNPIYTFSANSGDNPERFHLHFAGPFGINSQEDQYDFAVFSYEHSVYVKNISGREPNGKVSICNILGQKIMQKNIVEDLTKIDLAVSPGCYIVTLTSKNQITSKKVFIR